MVKSSANELFTNLFETAPPNCPDVSYFVNRQTPGNVGVCLSGGGSRAFTAGIGQLQALEALQANGASLLNQTRAISTVSGGGWIGIPFVYLPSGWADADFLGTYTSPANLTYDQLSVLPPEGIANNITSGFSIADLAVQALFLYKYYGVPSTSLWQVLIGRTFLSPYQLVAFDANYLPTDLFSYDQTSLSQYVAGPNPGLSTETAYLVAQPAGQQRPYLISLSSLSVNMSGGQQDMLAPVQSTPFVTGVLSTPPGALDANNRQVGGGGVSSFAFNSDPVPSTTNLTKIIQGRQWALTDAIGTSSAAFAQFLIGELQSYKLSSSRFAASLALHGPRAIRKLARTPEETARLTALLRPTIEALRSGRLPDPSLQACLEQLASLTAIVPAYQYWSVDNPPTTETVNTTFFADGGSLDNSGVASMLSNPCISNVIAFLNVETPISQDGNGNTILDQCIPPLFGYQPYSDGYATYASSASPQYPVFQYNQVFDSQDFQALQNGLAAAFNSGGAAIYTQTLTTVANSWFNVPAGTSVTVVWVYLSYASDWYDALSDGNVVAAVDGEYYFNSFPQYGTLSTQLSALQINLLSNFASWMVQDPANASAFTALYTTGETKA